MTPAVALLALACYAAAPAPLVGSDVHRALRGEPVAAAPAPIVGSDVHRVLRGEAVPPPPARADVAAAILRLRRPRP